ncbi:50S ribosomal protein L2 [Candidatus Saccharibacteria bacterium]|nr:ribosomal protein L2 [uncultured bacterium]PID30601.1 MAG: 50S ribosomal protein L2 [Candidatus Saccharibacteria bacterium]PID99318.1 MAG: 50S ribosomal protein L2 [Candidatus Saccharibacteria bacterium]
MAIKTYNPTTPGRRGMSSQDFSGVTTKKPVKSLVSSVKRGSGRNNQGRITTRHQGGGARKHYRMVNFDFQGEGVVEHIEYDPNRSARIARVKDSAGVYHYILAANGMRQGQKITSGEGSAIETGNRLALKDIPVGTTVHAIELKPGRGAQMVRSAGNGAQLTAKEGDYAQVKLPSGEVRKVALVCTASVGVVGNEQHQNVKIGKAGRSRHLGKRPTVRGVVMNAADHPHGGGDGGRHRMAKAPRTPWGQKTLGLKTRHRKSTNNMIVRSRHEAKRKR